MSMCYDLLEFILFAPLGAQGVHMDLHLTFFWVLLVCYDIGQTNKYMTFPMFFSQIYQWDFAIEG